MQWEQEAKIDFHSTTLKWKPENMLQNLQGCFKNEFNRPVFRTAIYGRVYCSLHEDTGEDVVRAEVELTVFTRLCIPAKENCCWEGHNDILWVSSDSDHLSFKLHHVW